MDFKTVTIEVISSAVTSYTKDGKQIPAFALVLSDTSLTTDRKAFTTSATIAGTKGPQSVRAGYNSRGGVFLAEEQKQYSGGGRPAYSGGRSGGGGMKESYRYSKEGFDLEQHRMDVRTAIMQAASLAMKDAELSDATAGCMDLFEKYVPRVMKTLNNDGR